MKTFVEKFIDSKSKTDLDCEYPFYEVRDDVYRDVDEEVNDDSDGEEVCNEVMIPHNKLSYVEAPSMSIDDVIEILNEFKTKGADRVYIADHSDHHGYYFYGVKLVQI
jgi:hypothetical protein